MGEKAIFFFVALFFCSTYAFFPAHRDSDQSLITEDGLQTWFNDFKQALLSMNSRNCLWFLLWCDLPCILVSLFLLVSELFSRSVPKFHDPPLTSAVFQTAHFGAMKTSRHKGLLIFSSDGACSNLFSTQNQDMWHSCNCRGRCLWFTVIHMNAHVVYLTARGQTDPTYLFIFHC